MANACREIYILTIFSRRTAHSMYINIHILRTKQNTELSTKHRCGVSTTSMHTLNPVVSLLPSVFYEYQFLYSFDGGREKERREGREVQERRETMVHRYHQTVAATAAQKCCIFLYSLIDTYIYLCMWRAQELNLGWFSSWWWFGGNQKVLHLFETEMRLFYKNLCVCSSTYASRAGAFFDRSISLWKCSERIHFGHVNKIKTSGREKCPWKLQYFIRLSRSI